MRLDRGGLAPNSENAQVLDTPNGTHDSGDLVRFILQSLEIVAIDYDCERTLYAADGLFQIVRDWLRETPENSRNLFQLTIHSRDQPIFVLMKDGAPLFFWQQVHKELRVEKACCVGPIIRAPYLVDYLRDFWK